MEIITGYTGKPHVTSEQDRDVNIGVVGEESYVLQTGMQLAAEVSSNNEIKIRDGVLMHQGCTASIKKNTYDSLTIINGSQGMKRIDLIVARYEKNQDNGIESLDLKVIQGTPAESTPTVPEYTEGDIQAGDYVADMPMYQVIIDGLNITEVKKVFEVAPGIDALKKEIAELNSKMIPVFVSNPFQFVGTGNKTLKYTVSGNGYAFISLSGHIGCDMGNDFGQLEAKIWDKNHILLTMDRCVETTTFNYDFGVACSVMLPVQDGDVITGTISATKTGKKTILANACCFGCQIDITHD